MSRACFYRPPEANLKTVTTIVGQVRAKSFLSKE